MKLRTSINVGIIVCGLGYIAFELSQVFREAGAIQAMNFDDVRPSTQKVMLEVVNEGFLAGHALVPGFNSVFELVESGVNIENLAVVNVFRLRGGREYKKSLSRYQRLKFEAEFLEMFCAFYKLGKGRFNRIRFDTTIQHPSGSKILNTNIAYSKCLTKASIDQLGLRSNTI